MAEKTTKNDEQPRRLQLLAQYRAWHEAFMREHTAAIARSRLLTLRRKEMNWTWLSL